MGQVLSIPLIVVGIVLLALSRSSPTLAPTDKANESSSGTAG
jgi:prolipoprotein diacylglyceryltransferase